MRISYGARLTSTRRMQGSRGEISNALGASTPLIIPVMMGGMVPASRILSQLNFPVEIDYVHATRYRGDVRGRTLEWIAHPSSDFKDRNVLVVDGHSR